MKKLSSRKRKWIERTVSNDRSYKAVLYNRCFILLISATLQLLVFSTLIWAIAYRSVIGIAVQVLAWVLSLIFAVHLLNKEGNPSMRISWIILILITPLFGVPMYLFNGRGRPARKLKKAIQAEKERIENALGTQFSQADARGGVVCADRNDALGNLIQRYGLYPTYAEGEVKYYPCGEKMFADMLEALQKAKRYILLEYFVIAHGKMWNEILKILLEKAMQGVQVRIVYDDFGCIVTLPRDYERYLEGLHENIKCVTFNRVMPLLSARVNHRDHRKILVVDGVVAFTGGINLADEYINEKKRFGHWKDAGVRITGTAVRSFVKMFFYLYNAVANVREDILAYMPEDSEVLPSGTLRVQPYDDSPLDNLPIAEMVYEDIIDCAKDYVWICTPYLVLDDKMRDTLCRAGMRGVDVRIVTPAVPDKKTTYRLTRANYAILLESGVKIYEYTPGFIHAKTVIADDKRAVVGTVNFDYRSFYHHFENAVYFSGCDAVYDLKKDCEETFAVSRQRTKENYKRSAIGRGVDSVLRAFETLF